jgi:hypothetical protein
MRYILMTLKQEGRVNKDENGIPIRKRDEKE